MATPTQQEINNLGPDVMPFDRSKTKTIDSLQIGAEDILYTEETGVYNATNNNEPEDVVKINAEELLFVQTRPNEIVAKKYLWVIQQDGVRIIPERIPNLKRTRKQIVCHTNLTGALRALQGGELYFCENGNIYINNSSDRYGCREDDPLYATQRQAVLDYFNSIYQNVIYLY